MKTIAILITSLLMLTFSACDKSEVEEMLAVDYDYTIFGHFYGMCLSEECVEIFKLAEGKLYEDITDKYPSNHEVYSREFTELSQTQYGLVSDLMDYFPIELLELENGTIGCPDCADQGGIYIEIRENGVVKHWNIDQSKAAVPSYLYDFMDKVNEKIQLINN